MPHLEANPLPFCAVSCGKETENTKRSVRDLWCNLCCDSKIYSSSKTRWKCSASVQIISGLQLLYMATLKLHTKKTGAILEGGFHAAKIRELYRKICLHQTVKFFYVKLMDIPLPVARDVGRTLSSAWFVSRCITVTLWPSSTSPLTIHAAAILPWFSMLQVSLKMSQLHYCLDWLPGTQKVQHSFAHKTNSTLSMSTILWRCMEVFQCDSGFPRQFSSRHSAFGLRVREGLKVACIGHQWLVGLLGLLHFPKNFKVSGTWFVTFLPYTQISSGHKRSASTPPSSNKRSSVSTMGLSMPWEVSNVGKPKNTEHNQQASILSSRNINEKLTKNWCFASSPTQKIMP